MSFMVTPPGQNPEHTSLEVSYSNPPFAAARKSSYFNGLQRESCQLKTALADEALGKPGDEASVNLSHVPIHMADQATDSFEQQFTLSLMENEERTLGEIDAALHRIEQGTFGCCEECQQTIPTSRLQALPYTCFCVECARKIQGGAREGQSR
jgi:DnaK suppressor protein